MPIDKVELLEGRAVDQKRALVRELTEVMVNCLAVSRGSVHVHVLEMQRENVAIGGVLQSDKSGPSGT